MQLAKLDLTDDEDKKLITQVYETAMASLGEADRKLPQIETLLPLLRRGIGVHHSGLLPILKVPSPPPPPLPPDVGD